MPDNPYEPPVEATLASQDPQSVSSERAAYNVVSDTVTGVNVRWSDNKFQAVFVLVSVLVAATLGSLVIPLLSGGNAPWYAGAMLGGFAGLVFGIFASGIYLMIHRAKRHLEGKHD